MMSDTKRCVGSAYGDQGIGSRWAGYAASGHGGNDELEELVKQNLDYPRKNFRFALLEYRAARTPEVVIRERESFWKEALFTRGRYGLNSN